MHAPTPLPAKFDRPNPVAGAVDRLKLMQTFARHAESCAVLVCAPAGFGKTLAMAQWAQLRAKAGAAIAWVALDERDADTSQLCATLATLLRLALGPAAPADGGIDPEALLACVRAAAGLQQPICLFLDDWHLASSPGNDRLLERFMAMLPVNAQMVIGSREALGAQTQRLRAAGRLIEIGSDGLAFDATETQLLFASLPHAAALTAPTLQAVHSRTLGWPVALQLARSYLELGEPTPGWIDQLRDPQAGLHGYLAEQIWERLPEDLRRFLLVTSVVEAFNGDLSAALTRRRDGWGLVDRLVRLGLPLMRLDGRGDWYRYHPLFLEFLRARAARTMRDAAALHLSAAQWLAKNLQVPAAARHALAGGNAVLAAQCLSRTGGWRLVMQGHGQLLCEVVERLPDNVCADFASLRLGYALERVKHGDVAGAADRVRQATLLGPAADELAVVHNLVAGYEDRPFPDDAEAQLRAIWARSGAQDPLLGAMVTNILCARLLQQGRFHEVVALGHTSSRAYRAADTIYGAVHPLCHVGQAHFFLGELDAASAMYDRIRQEAGTIFGIGTDLVAIADVLAAECALTRGDHEEAERLLAGSIDVIEHSDAWYDIYAAAYQTALRLCTKRPVLGGTDAVLQRIAATAHYRMLPRLDMLVAAERALPLSAELRVRWGHPSTWPRDPRRGSLPTDGLPGDVQVDEGAIAALSAREREILELLAQGLTAKESARLLGISDNTVKYHTKRLFAKLGTTRRVQALAEARRRGLLPP